MQHEYTLPLPQPAFPYGAEQPPPVVPPQGKLPLCMGEPYQLPAQAVLIGSVIQPSQYDPLAWP